MTKQHAGTALAVLCMTASTFAQDRADPEVVARGNAILDQTLARYRELPTYEHRVVATSDMKLAGGGSLPDGVAEGSHVWFARPNRIVVDAEQRSLHCDGEHLWSVIDVMGRYLRVDAPPAHDLVEYIDRLLGRTLYEHVPLIFLTSEAATGLEAVAAYGETRIVAVEEVGDAQRVQLALRPEPQVDAEVTMTLVVDDGLIRETRMDFTEAANAAVSMMPDLDRQPAPVYTRLVGVRRYVDVRVDGDVDDGRFAYEVPAGYIEAEANIKATLLPDRGAGILLGRSFAFESVDLDGNAISSRDLAGHIVVLHFWSTLSAASIEALRSIDELADRFADRDVVVLGIGNDPFGARDRVRGLLDEIGVGLRHIDDPGGLLAAEFLVSEHPATIVIGGEGTVQAAAMGGRSSSHDDIAAAVERLVAGEELVDASDRHDETASDVEGVLVEALRPELFSDDGDLTGRFSGGYAAIELDLDGDGAAELVAPTTSGTLTVVRADGTEASTIALEGLSGWTVGQLVAARSGDDAVLLVQASRWNSIESVETQLIMFELDGTRRWSWTPEIASNAACNMYVLPADLDADGEPEIVVGIYATRWQTTTDMNTAPTPQLVESHLALLSWHGEARSVRRVGSAIERIWLAESDPPRIMVMVDGRLRRFTWTP